MRPANTLAAGISKQWRFKSSRAQSFLTQTPIAMSFLRSLFQNVSRRNRGIGGAKTSHFRQRFADQMPVNEAMAAERRREKAAHRKRRLQKAARRANR